MVVIRGDKVVGVVRIKTALYHGLEGTYTGVSLEDVASRNFTIVHPEGIIFAVIGKLWKAGGLDLAALGGQLKSNSDLKQQMQDKLIEHMHYIDQHGQNLPKIRNWKWSRGEKQKGKRLAGETRVPEPS